MESLLDLTGHTALITGATGGIGADIARTLGAAGARIVLHFNTDKKAAEALAETLGQAYIVRANLAKPKQICDMIADLAAHNLTPDLLVNNAGVQTVSSILAADKDIWREINKVNLEAVYALTKAVSQVLIDTGRNGAIVNVASIEGLDPAEGHAHYAASKAALLMYTRAAALELGPKNIRVNAVAPGLIARPNIEKDWPDGVERWRKRAPLGRLGTGADVASAILYLLSPAALWISGHTLVVDGGMSAQNRW